MAHATRRVEGATLVDRTDAAQAIPVGTPAWYVWLAEATTFAFVGAEGRFTARKERRGPADGYWRAYRKRAGVVRSAYLGKTTDLTLERLQAVAATLAHPPPALNAPTRPVADPATPATEQIVRAAPALPTGTVTFLFTDIAGSTQLWEQHSQAMPSALARHDAILRAVIEAHDGAVFKTVGDSVHAVFGRASDALTAALSAQRALQAEAWGATGPLRVRMALHTGAAEPRGGDYVGPPLNRLARILAAGHGGQILLSQATAALTSDALPAGVILRDLGTYQLKGLRRPEQLSQIVSPDLPVEFPPLRTPEHHPAPPPAPPIPLLMTKLYVPPARPNRVSRPHLIARLQAGLAGTFTLIAAPAGFGKTTLLSDWRSSPAGRSMPLAWISLDAMDNDPLQFWRYVLTALDSLQGPEGTPAVAPMLALLESPQPPPIVAVLTPLLNMLSALPTDAVLVLEDYQLIDTPAIHQALAFLLDHLPPRLHLIMTTRADPPLPLPRLRARGQLAELRAVDLRFTPAEAATFLTDVMGLPLSADDIVALETRTEGWIAGLQFAALAMRDRTDLAGFVRTFTGSHRYVVDYLADEVLNRLPAHLHSFVLQTAILDRLCGPLCDAVVCGDEADPQTVAADMPRADSQALLEELERANLFLVPLDDERRWYRYHHLFAEVLQRRLQQTQLSLIPELHRRASAWYEQQGLLFEAVQHALAVPAFERAARLIEHSGPLVMLRGQVHTVLSWLTALPDALVRTSARLCLFHASMLMFTNQSSAAEERLTDAEACLQPGMPAAEQQDIRGQIALIRANLARFAGDLPGCIARAQQALEMLPAAEPWWRPIALVNVAHSYLLSGDVRPATERLIADVARSAQPSKNALVILKSITLRAHVQKLQGRLRQAAATYELATRLAPGTAGLPLMSGSPAYYFGLGDLLREWNDLEAADRLVGQGMELVLGTLTVDAEDVLQGYTALTRLKLAQGAGSSAEAVLEAFRQLAETRRFVPTILARAVALQAWAELAQGNLAAARRWANACGLAPTDADLSYPREQEYVTLARIRIAQGREDRAGRWLSDALQLLARLRQDAEAKVRMGSTIEILMLQALALDAQSERKGALLILERALRLAEPEGYIRLFLDAGEAMVTLLHHAHARGIASSYVATLLEASGEPGAAVHSPGTPSSSALVESLTKREREVLQLLVTGLSNAAIARELVITVGTVKRHVNSIYGKLGVNSRTQAVARAHTLHVL